LRIAVFGVLAGAVLGALLGCGGGGTGPSTTSSVTTTTSVVVSPFEIKTLLTVYTSAEEDAQFTEGTTRDDRIGRILLGVDALSEGTTALDNEGMRDHLQAAVGRVNAQFTDADYESAFDETKANLLRFLNDSDADAWSIDGRHGAGRDWPFDTNGNDPDGWTAQIVVTVTRP
jgi:hypothetical protein